LTSKNLSGKVALVTGASKGIGAGIAKELGASGAAVAVNYASDARGAGNVADEIRAAGGKAIVVQGDVSSINRTPHLRNRQARVRRFGHTRE
jgi:3-oxoacyl-[acyl-carrier protein] reductase